MVFLLGSRSPLIRHSGVIKLLQCELSFNGFLVILSHFNTVDHVGTLAQIMRFWRIRHLDILGFFCVGPQSAGCKVMFFKKTSSIYIEGRVLFYSFLCYVFKAG